MPLQLIVSAVYQTVRHSWLVAAVAVKYILIAYFLDLLRSGELEIGSFQKSVKNYSGETVAGIVVAGFVLAVLNYQPSPLLRPFSEFVALAYFAYLFWIY
ncbi:MAG: hypothetical protein ABEJ91_02840 [Candidatus Nanohaloarchaea archaeon]